MCDPHAGFNSWSREFHGMKHYFMKYEVVGGGIIPYSYTSSPNHNWPLPQPSEPLVIRSTPQTHHTPLNSIIKELGQNFSVVWSKVVLLCFAKTVWCERGRWPLLNRLSAASFVILILYYWLFISGFRPRRLNLRVTTNFKLGACSKIFGVLLLSFFSSSHFDHFDFREWVQPLQACSPLNILLLTSFEPFHKRCCVRLLVIVWNQWCGMRLKLICLCWLGDANRCIVQILRDRFYCIAQNQCDEFTHVTSGEVYGNCMALVIRPKIMAEDWLPLLDVYKNSIMQESISIRSWNWSTARHFLWL